MNQPHDPTSCGAGDAGAEASAPTFAARLDRRIVNAAGGSVRHLLITVRAPVDERSAARPRPPLNLGLVIDASGSMGDGSLDAAKTATLGIIDSLEPEDHLSIVSFASDVQTHLETTRMDEAGKRRARLAVRPLATRGNTNLAAGWLEGCRHVAGRQAVADVPERNQVILLSDGHANEGECGPEALAVHAAALHECGVLTSTVGIGAGYSPSQLQAIAEAGGGRMHDAETPDEIVEIVMAELDEALATTVEGLSLCLLLPPGVKGALYGTAPTTSRGTQFEIILGSMRSAATREAVVKLTFPPGTVGDRVAVEAAATWRHPATHAVRSCLVSAVEAEYGTAGVCTRQPLDPDLARIVAEHWQASVYHRGVALNQDGQGQEALTFVERQLRYFRRYCAGIAGLERLTASLEAFHRSLRHRYDAVAAKEVMLFAYKHSRGEVDHRSTPRAPVQSIVESQIDDRS